MFSKELTGASTIPIILSILSEGEDYGYQIIKKVQEYSGGNLTWSEPMLYPVLHRLDKKGLITSEWRNVDRNRKRKYYRITPLGRSMLAEKKVEWVEMIKLFNRIWNMELSAS